MNAQIGEPLDLYNAPANRFVAGFIGSPAMNFAAVSLVEQDGALFAVGDGIQFKLPPAKAEQMQSHVGERLTLGIRPEDLRVGSSGSDDHLSISAVVEVVEQLGSQSLLDVKVGSGAMVAAVEPTVKIKVREPLRLAFDVERLHFFDVSSGNAI